MPSAKRATPVIVVVTVVVLGLLAAIGGYSYLSSQRETEQAAVLLRQQAEERARHAAEAEAAKAAEQVRLAETRARDAEQRAMNAEQAKAKEETARLALEAERERIEVRNSQLTDKPPTPVSAPIASDAESLLRKMLIASQGNSDLELRALISQIGALAKPAKGNRKTARALNADGLALLRTGAAGQAIGILEQAVAADPADVEIIDNLGFASIKAGNYRKARAACLSALALAPSRSSAWANLGIALAETEGETQAVAAFSNAYRFSGDVAKTIAYLEALSENDPSFKVRAAARRALSVVVANQHAPKQG